MTERLNRAITQLRDEGVTVKTGNALVVVVRSGEEYILTNSQLLELMDNDQLARLFQSAVAAAKARAEELH